MELYNKYVAPYLKAHFAGLGIAIGLVLTDIQENSVHDLGSLTGYQWIAVVAAALGLGAAVSAVTNSPKADGTVKTVVSVDAPTAPVGVSVSTSVPAAVVSQDDGVNL